MNVYKLIQELARFDPDQEVVIDSEYTNAPIRKVEQYDNIIIIY